MNNSSDSSRRSRRLNGKRNFKSKRNDNNAKTPPTITITTTRRADDRDGTVRRYRAMDRRGVERITESPILGHPGRDRGP